uniref:Beta-defensin n=1 Tax=Erpetoichthys calabaricus TaxID=27687 RepID=A0A8C4RWY1_ERPCA
LNAHCDLLLLLQFYLCCCVNIEADTSLPWGCSNYDGTCRILCLPHEIPFGALGCTKGSVCCVKFSL